MAKNIKGTLLNYEQKQKILYIQKTPPARLLEIADQLLSEDRFSEAYDFIERAGDEKRLEGFMDKALARGDFFNFEKTSRRLDMEVSPELWEQLAQNALKVEMWLYAVEAYRRAGMWEKADAIIRSHPDFFGPAIEMEREKAIRAGKLEIVDQQQTTSPVETSQPDGNIPPDKGPNQPDEKKKKKHK